VSFKNILVYTFAIVFILVVLFVAYNNVAPVTVNLKFLGITPFTVPAWAVMVSSFLVGILVAFVYNLVGSAVRGIETLTTRKKMKLKEVQDQHYQDGLRHFLDGNFDEAERLFSRILEENPNDLRILTSMGNLKRAQRLFLEAEEYHMKVILIDEHYLQALDGLFLDYMAEGKNQLALNILEKLLEHKDSDKLKYKKELVNLYIADNRWEEATEIQEDIIKLTPKGERKPELKKMFALEYQKAVHLFDKNNKNEAEKILKRIKSQDDSFIPAYVKLGEIYLEEDDHHAALKTLSEGFSTTKEPVFLQMLEEIFIAANKPDDAIAFFKKLSYQYSDDVMPLFTLGKLYYRLEMIEDARAIFDKLTTIIDYSPTLEFFIAKTEVKEGRLKDSVKRMKEVIRKTHLLDLEYSCRKCGHRSLKWLDRCPDCGCWNCMHLAADNELKDLEIKRISLPNVDY
jgi:lipopolysaccharide biosynthesis regulator YciM